MPNRLSLPLSSVVFFALGLLAMPSPSFAGFEWVAPSDAAAQQPVMTSPALPAAPRAPAATAAPEIISPVIIGGNALTDHQAPMPPSSSVITEPSPSYVHLPTSVERQVGDKQAPASMALPALQAPTTIISAAPSSEVVRGFAKQVPLAVALRQILPAGYGFSVDPDVDLGILISFQGGKPWRETLRDALEPADLVMREQGQMVSVGHPSQTLAEVAPAPVPRVVDIAPMPSSAAMLPMVELKEPQVEEWRAERGDNLHKIIEAWAQRSHVELNWEAEYDYPLQASFTYTGTFEDAVRNLLTGFEDAHPQPIAELHTNPGLGLKVLLVQTRGNSYSD